jgi:hypothetical protein
VGLALATGAVAWVGGGLTAGTALGAALLGRWRRLRRRWQAEK